PGERGRPVLRGTAVGLPHGGRTAAGRREDDDRTRPAHRTSGGRASGQTAAFFNRRRSRSDSPPQIPNRSSFARAYSRHSERTSQARQTFLASLVEPPFSGKNDS